VPFSRISGSTGLILERNSHLNIEDKSSTLEEEKAATTLLKQTLISFLTEVICWFFPLLYIADFKGKEDNQ